VQHDAIAVVDFGGQCAHLIATKVRRLGVLAEIRQPEDPVEAFRGYRGIFFSGSPSLSSHGEDSDYTKAVFDLDVPILGLCFGHQEIAKHYGGEVTSPLRWGTGWRPVMRPTRGPWASAGLGKRYRTRASGEEREATPARAWRRSSAKGGLAQ